MNTSDYMKAFGLWTKFKRNHPKFPAFMKAATRKGLQENSVLEVKVTTASGEVLETNLKITADDLDFIQQMKEMM